jgi:preprotein translocase subunit SecG
MLYYFAATIYVLVCLVLMLVILLQQGKGGDIANAFGGGTSQAAFGARSGATVLSRATTIAAVLFILGALTLGIIGQRGPGSVVGGRAPQPLPTRAPAQPQPQRQGQTPPAQQQPAPAAPAQQPAPTPAP